MNTPAAQEPVLDDIRAEIDAIDDAILDLLVRRAEASERVKRRKAVTGALSVSPIRPAREASILHRLLERSAGRVSADLVVRLWRSILTASTLSQAPVSIHVSESLAATVELRLLLRDHFGSINVVVCRDDGLAMLRAAESGGDLCVVDTSSGWADDFVAGGPGGFHVIGTLPVIRQASHPALLVLGHSAELPSGDDETLIISSGRLPRDFALAPLWQMASGSQFLSSLPGFLSEYEGPLLGLQRSNVRLALRVAGRFPSQIEVKQ